MDFDKELPKGTFPADASVKGRAHNRCPYHSAKHLIAELRRLFGDMVDGDEFPPFPDNKRRDIKAEAVLEFIEAIALLMGEDLVATLGIRRFGIRNFR